MSRQLGVALVMLTPLEVGPNPPKSFCLAGACNVPSPVSHVAVVRELSIKLFAEKSSVNGKPIVAAVEGKDTKSMSNAVETAELIMDLHLMDRRLSELKYNCI